MKKGISCLSVLMALLFLSACSLLPEEEVYETSPVIRQPEPVSYAFTYVQRGELSKTESISCNYVPVRTEAYSFGVGGVLYDEVYVQKGDEVKAGSVLAALEMGDYPARIEQNEIAIQRLEVRIRHAQETVDARTSRYERSLMEMDEEARQRADTPAQYREKLQGEVRQLEEDLEIEKLKLSECMAEVAKRQIVAEFDGTVTYVRSVKTGDLSIENERFLRLADTTLSVFSAETRNYAFLNPGDFVTITAKKTEYDAVVASAEELGLKEEEVAEGEKKAVYFRLLEPAVELEGGDRGTLSLLLDYRADTLYVSSRAVCTVEGKKAVYRTDEYGLKSVVYVETGMSNEKYTEILSGLSEGDAVILG